MDARLVPVAVAERQNGRTVDPTATAIDRAGARMTPRRDPRRFRPDTWHTQSNHFPKTLSVHVIKPPTHSPASAPPDLRRCAVLVVPSHFHSGLPATPVRPRPTAYFPLRFRRERVIRSHLAGDPQLRVPASVTLRQNSIGHVQDTCSPGGRTLEIRMDCFPITRSTCPLRHLRFPSQKALEIVTRVTRRFVFLATLAAHQKRPPRESAA